MAHELRPVFDPSRRTALKGLLLGSATALTLPTLGGCGRDSSSTKANSTTSAGPPRRGGTVRAVALGSAADTAFDPMTVSGVADYLAGFGVWDNLVTIAGTDIELGVAESIEPDKTAQNWTMRLRKGVTWHDGSDLTSADVAWTLSRFADPKAAPNYAFLFSTINIKGIKELDARTLRIPLTAPRGDFVEAVLAQYSPVLKAGTKDFTKAQGTGPFRLETYRPGQTTRLVRNGSYWGGEVWLDALEVTSVAGSAARLNAVKGGQADYASGISPTGARTLTSGEIEVRRGGPTNSMAMCFAFNVSQKPFDDPRVVRAIKLAVDRKTMVDTVLAGYGQVGADAVGKGMPGYDTALVPATRDVATARSLFAEAGVTALTMRAADFVPGTVASAELLTQQLAEAGVKLTVEKAAADSYFADFAKVLSTPAQAFYFVNRPPAVHLGSYTGSASGFNVTGYRPADYDSALAAAQATVDDAARARAVAALQRRLQAEDGLVVWGYQENLDAARRTLRGVRLMQSVPCFGSAYYPGADP
jgi:peptide/nickel transport system substrate-binding protein